MSHFENYAGALVEVYNPDEFTADFHKVDWVSHIVPFTFFHEVSIELYMTDEYGLNEKQ